MAKQLRREWLERIKAVEREFLAARAAVNEFVSAIRIDPSKLPRNTQVRDANTMSDHLEGTYLIRLFAAFEAGLRSYRESRRATKPPVRDLVNSVAGEHGIPDELRDQVHEIREYRNTLVHEAEQEAEPVALSVARGRLCTYFARLPDEWVN